MCSFELKKEYIKYIIHDWTVNILDGLTVSPGDPGGPMDPASPRGPRFPSSPMGPKGPGAPWSP